MLDELYLIQAHIPIKKKKKNLSPCSWDQKVALRMKKSNKQKKVGVKSSLLEITFFAEKQQESLLVI